MNSSQVDNIDSCEVMNLNNIFSDKEKFELIETSCELIDIIINENPLIFNEPEYQELIHEEVFNLLNIQLNGLIETDNISLIEDINDIINEAFIIIHKYKYPKRSFNKTFIRKNPNINIINNKILYLKNKFQPEQKTKEWYTFRYEHITASSCWKAFLSDSTRNQLIYDKCMPFDVEKYNYINMEGPLHWGVKYEKVSIMIYEKHYNTKIDDFGCISHDKYSFLAASPDGINTCSKSNGCWLVDAAIKSSKLYLLNSVILYSPYWAVVPPPVPICFTISGFLATICTAALYFDWS